MSWSEFAIVWSSAAGVRQAFVLPEVGPVSIGSGKTCQIHSTGPGVCALHAEVCVTGTHVRVRLLSGGTLIVGDAENTNGLLSVGEEFRCGSVFFLVRSAAEGRQIIARLGEETKRADEQRLLAPAVVSCCFCGASNRGGLCQGCSVNVCARCRASGKRCPCWQSPSEPEQTGRKKGACRSCKADIEWACPACKQGVCWSCSSAGEGCACKPSLHVASPPGFWLEPTREGSLFALVWHLEPRVTGHHLGRYKNSQEAREHALRLAEGAGLAFGDAPGLGLAWLVVSDLAGGCEWHFVSPLAGDFLHWDFFAKRGA